MRLTHLVPHLGWLTLILAADETDSEMSGPIDEASDFGESSGSSEASESEALPSDTTLAEEIMFFTNLVSDVNNNGADYFMFLRTANIDIPKIFGSLANEVRTYSDDSYTTMLDDPDFDFSSLANWVTHLNWYSDRLAVSGINGYGEPSSSSSSSEDEASALYIPMALGLFAGIVGLL